MTTQTSAPVSIAAPRPYKILIAVDFEPTADIALRTGMKLAASHAGAELHVVHAVADLATLTSVALPTTANHLAQARELLRQRVETAWQELAEVGVIAHIRAGDPAEVVIQAAVDIDADLVVVGSHRRSGLSKLILGSVAERVLHRAHCAVLVAVPKDYGGTASASIEPPCTDCLATRKQSANARFWCERHSKPYLEPHIYVPRDAARSSAFRTY